MLHTKTPGLKQAVLTLLLAMLLPIACSSLSGTPTPRPTSPPTEPSHTELSPQDPSAPTSAGGIVLAPQITYLSQRKSTPDQVRFEHITAQQGFPTGSVYWITQDQMGFLWIGTSSGLRRYDGYQTLAYEHDPDDPNSLSHNSVFQVLEDRQGLLWVATYGGGLERFERDTGRFIHYRYDPNDPNSLSHNKVFGLYEDRSGVLWVATSGGGLNRYDPQIDGFVRYQHDPQNPDSLIDDSVTSIYEDRSGTMWVGTGNGLERLDRNTGRFTHYQHDPNDRLSLSDNRVLTILEDQRDILWVGTSAGGLNRYVPQRDCFIHFRHDPDDSYSLGNDNVFFLLEDQTGTLWVASLGGGLHQYDEGNARFVRYQHASGDPDSLSSNSVSTLFEDREGTIWIGTSRGLDKYAPQKSHFNKFLDVPFATTLLEDGAGSLWVGNTEGLHQLDGNLRKVTTYQFSPNDPASLSQGWVLALYRDRAGTLWVGTSGGGLNRFDEQTASFRHYRHDPGDPTSLSSDYVNVILEDEEGGLWLGTDGGLNQFDPQHETFRLWPSDPQTPQAARVETVKVMAQDRQGRIWLGGWGDGLRRFEVQTGQFSAYRHDPADPSSLETDFVTALYVDARGQLWVGTSEGLSRFLAESGGFQHYGPDQGLQADTIGAIMEDDNGHLWLSTPTGPTSFDPETEVFANYYVEQGVHGGSFVNVALKRRSGELLFGGADGVVVFAPDRIWSNPYAPPVHIVSIRQSGQSVELDQALEKVQAVTFSWPQRDFEFTFAALSYVQPERNQYAYKLEGYDSDWRQVGTNRTGYYANLPGGDYTLRVKASNNDGLWNETGASLRITVVPPLWDTWWFQGIVALSLVGIVFAGYRLRVRNIEARTFELERQVTARTQELATLNIVAQTASQSLKLDDMLVATLDKVLEVMAFDSGVIYLRHLETDSLQMACHRGLPGAFRRVVDKGLISLRAAESGKPILIEDTTIDPRAPQEIIQEGLRSVASLPLASRGEVQGVLTAASRKPRRFRQQDVDLLLSIGHQIGVAIENARLYEGTRDRLAQVSALQKTTTAVASTLELDELLHLITEQATALLQADGGILNLVDWDKHEDEAVACAGSAAQMVGSRSSLDTSLSGWVTLRNQPVIANQVQSDNRVDRPGLAGLEETTGKPIQNAAVAPLTIKDQVMGTLAVLDKQRGQTGFDQSDLDLLVAFANQAATAIENARLFQAEQRRAEQFRVISEVGRRITSFLELDNVLNQVASLVQRSFGYDHVGIALVEEGYAVYKVGAGETWEQPNFQFRPGRLKVGEEGVTGWVAAQGKPLLVPDVTQEPRYVWMEGSRTRSELALPITVKDKVIGVLDVQSNQPNAFDQSDIAVLQSLADQAAVAFENARLFNAEQRRAEQFRVISEVGSHVASLLTVEELLAQVAWLIQQAFNYYLVEIGLVEGSDLVFRTRASRIKADRFESFRLPVDEQSITGWVAATGKPLLVPDVSQEPRYVRVTAITTRSELAVPMKAQDKIIGVINIQSEHLDAFDESDLSVLQSLANQAAIAIENARLYEQAQKLAVMEERQRLARELHDAVTQTLFSASLIAEAVPTLWESDQDEGRALLAELRQLSRGALAEMRTLLLELRPAALVEANLRDLLHQLGEAVAGRTGVPVQVSVDDLCPLPEEVHVALYRIAQEALNNVVKHAQARRVQVRLRCLDGDDPDLDLLQIELSIADDGRGFDPVNVPPDRLGLGIIRERAQAIDASLDITSQPSRGTQITVVWKEKA